MKKTLIVLSLTLNFSASAFFQLRPLKDSRDCLKAVQSEAKSMIAIDLQHDSGLYGESLNKAIQSHFDDIDSYSAIETACNEESETYREKKKCAIRLNNESSLLLIKKYDIAENIYSESKACRKSLKGELKAMTL